MNKGLRFGAVVLVCAALAVAAPARAQVEEPMTDAEVASVGCVAVAATAGFATVAAGGVALAANGVGAASTAVVIPVVVATMAGACTLGSMAAPAFVWAKRHGHTVTSSLMALWPGSAR
ncbi:MAG TPA: hypothetical protein VD860_10765 [Azospirillum sp.]|nr:hypothetical protein [Azospirillum sp.]